MRKLHLLFSEVWAEIRLCVAAVLVDSLVFLLYSCTSLAGIAQLVEYKLPKLGVASSNLVARSRL